MAGEVQMWRGGVVETIETPVDEVWNCLGDFCDITKCLNVEKTSFEGERNVPGCIRYVKTKGSEAREELLAIDNNEYSLKYKMLDNNTFGFSGYEAIIKLRDVGDGKTSVNWNLTMDPVAGKSESETVTMMCKVFIGGIKKVEMDYQQRNEKPTVKVSRF